MWMLAGRPLDLNLIARLRYTKILVEIYSSMGGMDASRWTISSGTNWKVKVHIKTHDRAGSNFSLCMLSLQRS